MDLQSWLGRFLDGKKLKAAVSKCEDAFIESVEDLLDLYNARGKGELETVFPKMLAVKIDQALAELADSGGVENLATVQDNKEGDKTKELDNKSTPEPGNRCCFTCFE